MPLQQPKKLLAGALAEALKEIESAIRVGGFCQQSWQQCRHRLRHALPDACQILFRARRLTKKHRGHHGENSNVRCSVASAALGSGEEIQGHTCLGC